MAKQRIQGLRRKFLNNKRLQQEYAGYMNTLISKNYAELVPQQQLHYKKGKVWYIPHHGVIQGKGSLRVVFDCGATFKGASLNSELLPGPNLTSSLLGVLLRFRKEVVAFMGDIQAMFHQVKVAEEDRDFLRFLWWPDGDITQDLKEYRMTDWFVDCCSAANSIESRQRHLEKKKLLPHWLLFRGQEPGSALCHLLVVRAMH